VLELRRGWVIGLSEKIPQEVRDGAEPFLVDGVEHPQHVVAALQEEEVQHGDAAQHEALLPALSLQVHTNFLEVARVIEKFLEVDLLLAQDLVVLVVCAVVCQFEELAHRVRLPHEEYFEYLLEAGLGGGGRTRCRMSRPSRSSLLNLRQRKAMIG